MCHTHTMTVVKEALTLMHRVKQDAINSLTALLPQQLNATFAHPQRDIATDHSMIVPIPLTQTATATWKRTHP